MLQVAMRRRAACIGLLLFVGLAPPATAQTACDFTGTAGADNLLLEITGNDPEVVICTLGGNDRVAIKAPTVATENIKVVVNAGAGNDRVFGSLFTGRLDVQGGAGNDIVQGGSGSDLLKGGRGGDELLGGAGPDKLEGGPGPDNLKGQRGNDILLPGPGEDLAKGGPGADNVGGRQEPFPHIVEVCVDHVGPGESYIVVKIRGAPYTDFTVHLRDLAKPPDSETLVGSRQTGPTGRTESRIPISDYGTYELRVSSLKFVPFSFKTSDINSDTATVNVTPAEGCTPDPN